MRARLPILLALVVAASLSAACTVGSTRLSPRVSLRAPPFVTAYDPTDSTDPEPDPDHNRLHVMIRGVW